MAAKTLRRRWYLYFGVLLAAATLLAVVLATTHRGNKSASFGSAPPTTSSPVGSDTSSSPSGQSGTEQLNATATISYPATIPLGYAPPPRIEFDSVRGGVWFVTNSSTETRAFHALPNGNVQSWHVGDLPGDGLSFGTEAGLALDKSGNLWFGAGTTLAKLDPASGAVSFSSVPVVDSPAAEGNLPASLRGRTHEIRSLSASDGGLIAIAIRAAASVDVVAQDGKLVSEQGLSSTDEANDVAWMTDGSLAIGLTDDNTGSSNAVEVIPSSGGSATIAHVPSHLLAKDGAQVVAGGPNFYAVNRAGSASAYPAVSTATIPDGALAVAANGRVAAARRDGVVLIDPSGRPSYVQFPPDQTCIPTEPLPPTGTPTPPTPRSCPVRPVALAMDTSGSVWFVPSNWTGALGLIRGA